jgi:inner membrane protein
MLAKAHVTIGMAAAFTVAQPQTIPEALPVIVGASLGCLICDIDCDIATEKTDSSHWRMVMAAIAVAALIEDHLLDAGMWLSLADRGSYLWFAGLVGFVLTCTFAGISSHRGFSHSLLALALETISVWLVFPTAAMPFAIAFTSHLILDVMNKRPVRLLYPAKKGMRLGWFYADRLANKVFAIAGGIWLIAVIIVNRVS